MATTTNYGWTTPDDTALVKDGASAIRTLGSSVDTTTKALNPSTTLGDIEYRSSTANTNTRLGIGSTGQVLTVAAGVPSWAALPAGGGMTLISETVASANSSITFGSISGSYKQLLLIWSGVRHSGQGSQFAIRLNNSSSAVYNSSGFQSYWPGAFSNEGFSRTSLSSTDYMPFGKNTSLANVATDCAGFLLIDNYASATKSKTWELKFNYYDQTDDVYRSYDRVGFFNDTTAITSIDIVRLVGSDTISNQNNTTIRLYGVA